MLLIAIISLLVISLLLLAAFLGRGEWVAIPLGIFAAFMMLAFFLQPISS